MVIGRNDPKLAKNTGLKEAIEIGLDDAFTALEEAVYDLSDEQVAAFPVPGRNNIAWIVMHVLINADEYAVYTQTYVDDDHPGKQAIRHERPKPGDPFPSTRELLERIAAVRDAAMEIIASAEESDLRRPIREWWKAASDAYMRTIFHALAHLRQIWLLRGALGLTDGKSWPQQHWA
jgi:hypothetical protein